MKAILAFAALALLGITQAHAAPLPAGISGAWYNPAQSGHGVSVEILDAERAVVFWYTYDFDGDPLNLYVEARIEDNVLVGTAYAPRGMLFGEFDPADLQMPVWGTLAIDFADCNAATLHYEAQDAAYGEGDIPLLRLTRIQGSVCSDDAVDVLP